MKLHYTKSQQSAHSLSLLLSRLINQSMYLYSNFSRPTDSGAIGKDQSHNANKLKSTRPMGMFQGNLFRGIDNCYGAAQSVASSSLLEGPGNQFQYFFFFISTQKN